jgi:hypothetical protein
MSLVNTLPKASQASDLYRILLSNFDLTHWHIRTILLQRLGFTREQIQSVMKRNRRRVREANLDIINAIVSDVSPLEYHEQTKRLRYLQQLNQVDWSMLSDIIRRLNDSDPVNRRARWSRFNALRQSESKEALRRYDEMMIGVWLRIEGHAEPMSMNLDILNIKQHHLDI